MSNSNEGKSLLDVLDGTQFESQTPRDFRMTSVILLYLALATLVFIGVDAEFRAPFHYWGSGVLIAAYFFTRNRADIKILQQKIKQLEGPKEEAG